MMVEGKAGDGDKLRTLERVVVVVEFQVGEQKYIPLLHSISRKEWELPGGELGITAEEMMRIRTRDRQQATEQRDDAVVWKFSALREVREELGITAPSYALIPLSSDIAGAVPPTLAQGGSGRELAITSHPFTLGVTADTLPLFTPTTEHNNCVWIAWPDWKTPNARSSYLGVGQQIQESAFRLNIDPSNVATIVLESDTPSQTLPLSSVTRNVLTKYLAVDFG